MGIYYMFGGDTTLNGVGIAREDVEAKDRVDFRDERCKGYYAMVFADEKDHAPTICLCKDDDPSHHILYAVVTNCDWDDVWCDHGKLTEHMQENLDLFWNTAKENVNRLLADRDLFVPADFLKHISVKQNDPKGYNDFKEKYGYDNNLTGYDLLHGHCGDVAKQISNGLGQVNTNVTTRTERAYVNEHNPRESTNYSHEYCVVTLRNGTELYADIRGICDDYDVFMQEFVDYEREKHGETVERWVRDSNYKPDTLEGDDLAAVKQMEDIMFHNYHLMVELMRGVDEYSKQYNFGITLCDIPKPVDEPEVSEGDDIEKGYGDE